MAALASAGMGATSEQLTFAAAAAEVDQRAYLADNAKECGNSKFKAGKYADAIDWYDKGLVEVDVLMTHANALTHAAANDGQPLNKKSRKLVKRAKLLHAQLNSNRCKALCKVGRWGDARAAAATVRAADPTHEGAIKFGAHAALGEGDASGPEWDLLRNYALTHPEDAEAQELAAQWEELTEGVAPALLR